MTTQRTVRAQLGEPHELAVLSAARAELAKSEVDSVALHSIFDFVHTTPPKVLLEAATRSDFVIFTPPLAKSDQTGEVRGAKPICVYRHKPGDLACPLAALVEIMVRPNAWQCLSHGPRFLFFPTHQPGKDSL